LPNQDVFRRPGKLFERTAFLPTGRKYPDAAQPMIKSGISIDRTFVSSVEQNFTQNRFTADGTPLQADRLSS